MPIYPAKVGDWTPLQLRQFVIETIKQVDAAGCQKSHSSHHHTKAQIVSLIEQNLPALREQFGSDTFQSATFKHALKLLTTLKPGDLEQMKDGVTRWDEIT